MELQVNEERLKAIMAERGISSYEELADVATARGAKIHWRTIYQFAKNSNWTRGTLQAVCLALGCEPKDIIPELGREYRHTHATPQLAQELQATVTEHY